MGNEDKTNNQNQQNQTSGFSSWIIRFIVTAIVLTITSYLTPGFSIQGFWAMIFASVVIILADYGVEKLMGVNASPFGKGLKGFIITAIILYLTQFIVPGMKASILGAIIAAVIIGVIDAIIPGEAM